MHTQRLDYAKSYPVEAAAQLLSWYEELDRDYPICEPDEDGYEKDDDTEEDEEA